MRIMKREQDGLRKILRRAYFKKESITVGNRWQHGVMRHIRTLAPADSEASYFLGFEQLVWKLTPTVCMMIVVLAFVLYHFEIFPEYGVLQALANGDEELSISQIVGI